MKCSMNDCLNQASFVPALVLRVHKSYKNDTPLQVLYKLYICIDHAEDFTIKDLLSDEAWDQIVYGIMKAGRVAPDKTRTELKLLTLKEAQEYWDDFENTKGGANG